MFPLTMRWHQNIKVVMSSLLSKKRDTEIFGLTNTLMVVTVVYEMTKGNVERDRLSCTMEILQYLDGQQVKLSLWENKKDKNGQR